MDFTKRTLENLSSLNHIARAVFERFLEKAQEVATAEGVRIEVISGLRSWAQQAALYAQGRTKPGPKVTKAPPGSSWHQYGLAMDLGLFRNGVYLDEKEPTTADRIYDRLGALAKDEGIEWAGYWTKFTETPHFQYTGGLATIEAARAKFLAVGDVQLMIEAAQ